MKLAKWQIVQRMGLPLEIKIRMSQNRIRQWYEHWGGNVYVSFSGGIDSTVLLHLVRAIYPNVPAVCVNALLYPETNKHVRCTKNVIILRPEKTFKQVIEDYGYPVVSKRISYYIRQVRTAKGETATKRLRLTGIRSDGVSTPMGMISLKWQYLCNAPFRISDRCCYWLKEKPLHEATSRFGYPFIGIRADESLQRKQAYYSSGCNTFESNRPRSWPLAFWRNTDIWEYVHRYNVKYSTIYDLGYTRTGCFACMFGVHLETEPNRFQRMRETHPALWHYCENIGIPGVLDYLKVPHTIRQIPLFEIAASGRVSYGLLHTN